MPKYNKIQPTTRPNPKEPNVDKPTANNHLAAALNKSQPARPMGCGWRPEAILVSRLPMHQQTNDNFSLDFKRLTGTWFSITFSDLRIFAMRDAMKSDQLDEERDRWVNSLDEGEICRLASSFHNGDPCTIFRPRKRGGFNICFFIEFESPLERWAARIPIPVMVPKAVLDEKTEIELATMR